MIPSGDLNGDGSITGADWTIFKAGQGTNFAGMSKAEAYLKGDLTGNLTHDLGDFSAFRTAYLAANPARVLRRAAGRAFLNRAPATAARGGSLLMVTGLTSADTDAEEFPQ